MAAVAQGNKIGGFVCAAQAAGHKMMHISVTAAALVAASAAAALIPI